jgi:hypothetical protein
VTAEELLEAAGGVSCAQSPDEITAEKIKQRTNRLKN